jgi:hypothetical protein
MFGPMVQVYVQFRSARKQSAVSMRTEVLTAVNIISYILK